MREQIRAAVRAVVQRALLVFAVLTALVALSGCTPPDGSNTGAGGGVSGAAGRWGCDPAGFGPFSGCDTTSDDEADEDTFGEDVCPPEYGAVVDEHGEIDFTSPGTFNVEPGSPCEAQVEEDQRRWADEFTRRLAAELEHPTPREWTVKDTSPHPDGCLVGMDEVGGDGLFTRRPLPGPCAQYPIGSHQHTGGDR